MERCVAAIGTFDGVHRGHLKVLDRIAEIAKEKGIGSRVITFMEHPLSVIAPERAPKWILPRQQSVDILSEYVERVSEMHFTPELSRLTAEEFMKLIKERYGVDTLVMGYDNTFGSDRLQSQEKYVESGRRAGIGVEFVDADSTVDGEPASSSRLRKAIAEGNFDLVREIYGVVFEYEGTVVEGKHNGRKIGFPTMNIKFDDDIVSPPEGVYLALVYLNGPQDINDDEETSKPSLGVLSIGHNPTMGKDNPLTWELHVVGRNIGDRYGDTISFSIQSKIRDIKKFNSPKELKRQIQKDIKSAKSEYLKYLTNKLIDMLVDDGHNPEEIINLLNNPPSNE